KKN
ncbi:unnamed protein product, partial [Leptidea sinapis]